MRTIITGITLVAGGGFMRSASNVDLARKDYVDIFLGFAEGFGFSLAEKCIQDSVSFEQEAVKAVASFELKTKEGVKGGLKILGEAMITELPPALKACHQTEGQIATVIKALSSFATPASFTYHMEKDLLVNGVDIFRKINGAIGSWKSNDYATFGLDIGAAVRDVVLGSALTSMGPDDYMEAVAGVGRGMGMNLVAQCVTFSESLADDVELAMKHFEKKTPEGMKEGMKVLGNALVVVLPPAISNCKNSEKDVEKVKKALSAFQSPLSFAYHFGRQLIVNSVNIYRDMNTAIGAWHSEKYGPFGESIGTALHRILLESKRNLAEVEGDEPYDLFA